MLANYPRPTFVRRLGIIFYDLLLAVSFVMVMGFITHLIIFAIKGNAAEVQADSSASYAFFAYYLFLGYAFFGWFWTHGGQTLGMRAWKVRTVNFDGSQLNWSQAFIRYVFTLILPIIGPLWVLFNKDKLGLHDRLSKTQLVWLEG
jgi:uncharacterized RDD family membrane protein YckC